MSKNSLIFNSKKLDYVVSDSGFSNILEGDLIQQEIPSVSYLNSIYENELFLPIAIFKSELAPLQTVVKYLKEEKKISNKRISEIIGRDIKTVWLTYNSVKNIKIAFNVDSDIFIPVSILKKENSHFSVLEEVVLYLKEKGFGFSEIARFLDRDPRTIWTVYSRSQKKLAKNSERKIKNKND